MLMHILYDQGLWIQLYLDLELQYVLDARKAKNQRLFFLDHEDQSSLNRSITVKKGREWKHSFTAYLPSTTTIRDKLNKLDIEVESGLRNECVFFYCFQHFWD